uniref:Uncharacterized protein n=1 Tax=uncultured marine virus TaxID=186617 RepID=A0A0F7LA85_9VIRU|nr:hypothetical protein [uncultured marine virus]
MPARGSPGPCCAGCCICPPVGCAGSFACPGGAPDAESVDHQKSTEPLSVLRPTVRERSRDGRQLGHRRRVVVRGQRTGGITTSGDRVPSSPAAATRSTHPRPRKCRHRQQDDPRRDRDRADISVRVPDGTQHRLSGAGPHVAG